MKLLIFLATIALAAAAVPRPIAKPAILLRRTSNFHRITNGRNAEPGEFPYQLAYKWGFEVSSLEFVCGASILSPLYALTAGHCIAYVLETGEHVLFAGINQLDSPEGQRVNAVTRVIHPDYDHNLLITPNDLGILGFDVALVFGDLVQPVALTLGNLEPLGIATLSGWGYTSTTGAQDTPNDLQTVELPVLSNDECYSIIDGIGNPGDVNPYVPIANICTGPTTDAKSACGGDSGSPLVQDGRQIGIVSWGYSPCGYPGAPSVFTNVANYLDFIREEAHLSKIVPEEN